MSYVAKLIFFTLLIYNCGNLAWQVIPPGMDFSNVVAEDVDGDGDGKDDMLDGASPRSLPPIWAEVGV